MIEAMKKAGLVDSSEVEVRRWLRSWATLQEPLANCGDESKLLYMVKYEKEHKNREHIVNRIWTRYKTVRNKREEAELESI